MDATERKQNTTKARGALSSQYCFNTAICFVARRPNRIGARPAPINGGRAKPKADAVPPLHGHLHRVHALHAVRIVPRAADAAIAIHAAAIVHVLVVDRKKAVLRVNGVLRAAQRDARQTDAMIDRRRAAEQAGVARVGGPLWKERREDIEKNAG